MRELTFDNPKYMAMLNRQTIHMDQGASYNPEYLATREMRYYPSRLAQIIRAVYLEELEASQHGADAIFSTILSGQGERWQNFGEDQSDYLLVQLMGRALFSEKGFGPADAINSPVDEKAGALWRAAIKTEESDIALFLDIDSYTYAPDFAGDLASFLRNKGIKIRTYGPYDTGFSLMAGGRLAEGIEKLRDTCRVLSQTGIKKVITVSGLGLYALGTLAPIFGIPCDFSICDILDAADGMNTKKAFIYGGSFYSRYTKKAFRLCELTANTIETPVKNAWEFQPLVNGNRRVNVPNIWESPLLAEYLKEETAIDHEIFAQAMARILSTNHAQLVVCSPLAYNRIKNDHKEAGKLVYFWQALK